MDTLVIDIGGSRIKMMVMDEKNVSLTDCLSQPTPQPSHVTTVIPIILKMIKSLPVEFHRTAVGFPGVVQTGVIKTAPNMDSSWLNLDLEKKMHHITGTPTKAVNDADLLGYGFIQGKGTELVIILGTGMGSALFVDGLLVPNLELGHHPFQADLTYEQLLGKTAIERDGINIWNANLQSAIKIWKKIFNYSTLYLSGGHARNINFSLPESVKIIEYTKGLRGGLSLWSL